jgi:hypothetical protein
MIYVWASLSDIRIDVPGSERTNGYRTRHIKGYGRAVSFSAADKVAWSAPRLTYSTEEKTFKMSLAVV